MKGMWYVSARISDSAVRKCQRCGNKLPAQAFYQRPEDAELIDQYSHLKHTCFHCMATACPEVFAPFSLLRQCSFSYPEELKISARFKTSLVAGDAHSSCRLQSAFASSSYTLFHRRCPATWTIWSAVTSGASSPGRSLLPTSASQPTGSHSTGSPCGATIAGR